MAIDKIDRVVLNSSVKKDIDSRATKVELENAKIELQNQIGAVVSDLDWKESVATFSDISTTYSNPDDGWTVNVMDTDITYRYNGSSWIPISANSIPLASPSVDGKMSKSDKAKLNSVETGAEVNLTPDEMLEAIKTVDADTSGLNANTLQGKTADKFAAADHLHDGRYYTESEANTLLNGKSNVGHTHDDRYYTQLKANKLINTKIDELEIGGRNLIRRSSARVNFAEQPDIKTSVQGFDGQIVKDGLETWVDGRLQGENWSDIANGENLIINDGTWGNDSLIFNGNTTYAELKEPLELLNGSFTVETEVKYNGGRGIILGDFGIDGSTNTNFEFTADQKLRVYWNNGAPNIIGTVTVPTGEWMHVAFVYDKVEQEVRGYVDGGLALFKSVELSNISPTKLHRMGRDGRTGATALDGEIREFRIYSKALSVDEISKNMQSMLQPEILIHAKQYALSQPLQPDEDYTISVDGELGEYTGVWLGSNYFAGYLEDGVLTFKPGKEGDTIIIKSSGGHVDAVKLEKGNKATDWTPAPEDVDEKINKANTRIDGIDNELSNKSDIGHNHDNRYYTESEMDSKLSNKSNTGHTHDHDEILRNSNAHTAGDVFASDRGMIDTIRSNKTAFMPANAIKVEYTIDNGKTWIDYGMPDKDRMGLFSQNRDTLAYLGKATTPQAVGKGVRITVEPIDRYTAVDTFYCWFCTSGATNSCTIERSTIGAKTTFSKVKENVLVDGWSGDNEITFPRSSFGGNPNQTNNNYAYRFTFMTTAISDTYYAPWVTDLRMYGTSLWGKANPMMEHDHIYDWDVDQNTTFPAEVKATTFKRKSDDVEVSYADHNHDSKYYSKPEVDAKVSPKANTNSPTFTGIPAAPTAKTGANTTQLATTAFVQNSLSNGGYGDMLKSTFASNSKGEQGYVDKAVSADKATTADSVPWSGVSGKPSVATVSDVNTLKQQVNESLAKKVEGTVKISCGTTTPTSPNVGDLWIDTN